MVINPTTTVDTFAIMLLMAYYQMVTYAMIREAVRDLKKK